MQRLKDINPFITCNHLVTQEAVQLSGLTYKVDAPEGSDIDAVYGYLEDRPIHIEVSPTWHDDKRYFTFTVDREYDKIVTKVRYPARMCPLCQERARRVDLNLPVTFITGRETVLTQLRYFFSIPAGSYEWNYSFGTILHFLRGRERLGDALRNVIYSDIIRATQFFIQSNQAYHSFVEEISPDERPIAFIPKRIEQRDSSYIVAIEVHFQDNAIQQTLVEIKQ